jgi:hypothetical protein
MFVRLLIGGGLFQFKVLVSLDISGRIYPRGELPGLEGWV